MRHLLIGVVAAAALVAGAPAALAAVGYDEAGGQGKLGQVGAEAMGGIAGYTGEIGNLTGTGVSWGAMATAQPSRMFGFEVGYQGSRIPVNDPRTDGGAIIQNGLQGIAKLYAPLEKIRPFVGAGLGLSYANPTDQAQSSGLYRTDWITEVPLAAGVEYKFRGVTAGARATYSPFYGEGFADKAEPTNPQGSMIEGRLVIGGQF